MVLVVLREMFGTQGDGKSEAGAAAGRILIFQVALVGLRQHLRIGQSESGADGGGCGVVTNLIVTVEYLVLFLSRHTRSVVEHRYGNMLPVEVLESDDDFAGGILHRISNKIHHRLHHLILVHEDHNRFVGQLQLEVLVLHFRGVAELVVDLTKHLGNIGLATQKRDTAILLLLEVEQLVGDAEQVVHVATHSRGVTVLLHLLQRQAHQRERRANFVDEVDEEPDFRLEGFLLLLLLELAHLLLVAAFQAALRAIVGVEDGGKGQQDVEEVGEIGAIPRWQNGDAQPCLKAFVGLPDLSQAEHIVAGWQISIGGLRRRCLVSPCAVEAFQHVLVLRRRHTTIACRSEVQCKTVVGMGQLNLLAGVEQHV